MFNKYYLYHINWYFYLFTRCSLCGFFRLKEDKAFYICYIFIGMSLDGLDPLESGFLHCIVFSIIFVVIFGIVYPKVQ